MIITIDMTDFSPRASDLLKNKIIDSLHYVLNEIREDLPYFDKNSSAYTDMKKWESAIKEQYHLVMLQFKEKG